MFTLYTLFDAVGRQYLLDRLTNSLTIYFCSPHCAAATRPACSVDNFLGSCVFSVSPPLLGSYSIYVRTHTYTAAPSFVVLASCRSGWVAWDVRFFRCCCFTDHTTPGERGDTQHTDGGCVFSEFLRHALSPGCRYDHVRHGRRCVGSTHCRRSGGRPPASPGGG